MVSASATIPLSTLLRQYQLGLVQITGFNEASYDDAQVQWVHGTDLADPTPFITPRTVLLTTGSQFLGRHNTSSKHREYVSKLIEAGVCALGFAINFGHERIPEGLVDACEDLGLPLFRVPYSTPFIAISQTAARLINEQSRARDVWSISAQRSVALAALQQTGLNAVIRELSTQLGSWVALFDATGNLITSAPTENPKLNDSQQLKDDVQLLLTSQTRASRTTSQEHDRVTLQTLGRRGKILGVLAIHDTGNIDYAAQSVISIVVALGSITLEQHSALSAPREQLRGAVVDLLSEGKVELAVQIAQRVFGGLPQEPVVCAFIDLGANGSAVIAKTLRQMSGTTPSEIFVVDRDAQLLAFYTHRVSAEVKRELERTHAIAGISQDSTYEEFSDALAQAQLALSVAQTRNRETVERFTIGMQSGMLELLIKSDEAQRQANRVLQPIEAYDERHGERILETLTVWLRNHGQYAPAAVSLGVHRHTLKSRIARAGALLAKDLNDVSVRADLWAALTTKEKAETESVLKRVPTSR